MHTVITHHQQLSGLAFSVEKRALLSAAGDEREVGYGSISFSVPVHNFLHAYPGRLLYDFTAAKCLPRK